MSEFHEGRVAATFQVGARLENVKETYEKEIITIEGARNGLMVAVKALADYCNQVAEAGIDGKIPIKETDVAVKHINGCKDLIQALVRDVEHRRVSAVGAVDALKKVLSDTKSFWEEEQTKLKQIQSFEATKPQDLKQRPVGFIPKEHPIEEYNKETSEQSVVPNNAVRPTNKRRRGSRQD